MSDDWRFVLRALGCLPTCLGAAVILLGSGYAFAQWRYWMAFLLWALMWGLMLVGLGLVIMSTERRWMAALGAAACSASALLVFLWERHHSLGDWSLWIYPPDALGILGGLTAIALWTQRKWARDRRARNPLKQPTA